MSGSFIFNWLKLYFYCRWVLPMWTHSCVFLSQWCVQLSRLHDSTWASIKTLHIAVRSHIRPKNTKRFFFFLEASLELAALLWPFWEHGVPPSVWQPCTPPRTVSIRDMNKRSWSRNHSREAGLQVGCCDWALMPLWWLHMGRHGFVRMCLHHIWCLRTAHQLLFSPLWRGIFLWQAASEKAIKNSQTAHHNARYHFVQCVFHVPCSFSLQWAGYF